MAIARPALAPGAPTSTDAPRTMLSEHAQPSSSDQTTASEEGYPGGDFCFELPLSHLFEAFTERAAHPNPLHPHARYAEVTTHDSIFLGEDGPTHQPIEHLASFRAMPNLYMMRPADATEAAAMYAIAVKTRKTPSVMAYTRQGTSKLDATYEQASKGAYVLSDNSGGKPEAILIGTGSEVDLCIAAAEALRAEGKKVSVVSMPCWEVFEEQSAEYKESVLPSSVPMSKRMVCEAGSSFGWTKYAGVFACIDGFGASAPIKDLREMFGFTEAAVTAKAKSMF